MMMRMTKRLMNKDNRAHWYMDGRHNDEVHCSNCNHAVGVQYDEEDNIITTVPMVCPRCNSKMYDKLRRIIIHTFVHGNEKE